MVLCFSSAFLPRIIEQFTLRVINPYKLHVGSLWFSINTYFKDATVIYLLILLLLYSLFKVISCFSKLFVLLLYLDNSIVNKTTSLDSHMRIVGLCLAVLKVIFPLSFIILTIWPIHLTISLFQISVIISFIDYTICPHMHPKTLSLSITVCTFVILAFYT